MRLFDYSKLREISWDSQIVSYIAQIQECKGRQELYIRQKPVELNRLVDIAKIQSTEASNRIEGIVTTEARLKQLVADKTTPRNRDEKEILGYRNVLNVIHESYEYIPLNANYILQLHRDLLKYTELSYGGRFKTTPNEIDMTLPDGTRQVLFKPLEPFETPAAVESACCSYNDCLGKEIISPLLLIPCFILDFLCIHPFNDGNGRMSRLLTLLLLYRSGYLVGKYISMEKAIADTKEEYYDALQEADRGWLEEKHDPVPFIKYMLGVILACYRDFENRVTLLEKAGNKSTAYDIVKAYVEQKLGLFTKQEVASNCPSISRASIEAALKRLVEEGCIVRKGAGRNTCYGVKQQHTEGIFSAHKIKF